jgi:hypothetical protein
MFSRELERRDDERRRSRSKCFEPKDSLQKERISSRGMPHEYDVAAFAILDAYKTGRFGVKPNGPRGKMLKAFSASEALIHIVHSLAAPPPPARSIQERFF